VTDANVVTSALTLHPILAELSITGPALRSPVRYG